jgi:Zn-dependent M28 family amino/carboxypeptidase
MILSQLEKTYGWDRVQAYIQKGSLQLKNSSGEDEQRPDMDRVPSVTISEKLLPSLFAAEKYSADSLLILLANRHSLPAFLLQKRLRLHWEFRSDSIMQAQNVVGMIPGNDVDLQHEYVGIGAHYDHIGMSGDTVFNGADDNASGTVAIMEAARALARNRHNKRSILIILHTAEEKGLLGSKYMSQQPELTDRMMAYINLDMVGCGPVDSLYSVGADHISSELQEIVEKTNAGSVRFKFNYELNNPNHPERIYYRSDHYSYARKGIPVVFFTDFYMKEYHTPGDDLEKLNIDKITRVAELTYRLALELANHPGKLKSN